MYKCHNVSVSGKCCQRDLYQQSSESNHFGMYLMKVHHMSGTLVQIMDTVQDDFSLHGCDDTRSLKARILSYINVKTSKTLMKILNAL